MIESGTTYLGSCGIIHICIYIFIYIYICVCVYIYIYTHVFHISTYMYVFTYAHTHVYMYIYICMLNSGGVVPVLGHTSTTLCLYILHIHIYTKALQPAADLHCTGIRYIHVYTYNIYTYMYIHSHVYVFIYHADVYVYVHIYIYMLHIVDRQEETVVVPRLCAIDDTPPNTYYTFIYIRIDMHMYIYTYSQSSGVNGGGARAGTRLGKVDDKTRNIVAIIGAFVFLPALFRSLFCFKVDDKDADVVTVPPPISPSLCCPRMR